MKLFCYVTEELEAVHWRWADNGMTPVERALILGESRITPLVFTSSEPISRAELKVRAECYLERKRAQLQGQSKR